MKKLAILFLSACVLAMVTHAQAPEAAGYASQASLQVETKKSIDAKKVKVGDEVTAVLTQDVLKKGKIILPRGSKVTGHIIEAQQRTKENPESRLGLVFDKVIAKKGGGEMECYCTVAAVAPPMVHEVAVLQSGNMGVPQTVSQPRSTRASGRARTGGGVVTQPAAAVTMPPPDSVPSSSRDANNRAATGALSSGSRGAIGMEDMTLNSSGGGSGKVPILISEKKNVKLESGTQLVLLISEPDKR